jgi:hypothetical protein
MPAAGSDPVEGAPSTSSVEALMRECESLTGALAQARKVRRILIFAFLLFVIAVTLPFYRLYRSVTEKENVDRLLATVQQRLTSRSDVYMREVQMFVDSTSPVITEAFYSRSTKDLPLLLQGVEKERADFVVSLQERLAKALSEHYDAMISKHEAILIKELPETQDPEVRRKLVANLHVVFERLVKKYYADELKLKLTALYDSWDHFPAANKPGKDEATLEQQFIGTLLEAVSHRLAESSQAAQPTQ